MDEMIYNGLSSYFNVLEKTGYMSYVQMQRLLVLIFYNDFVYNDFRGNITKEDYRLIERALDCLYGSSCLIPYPNYLKMGKMHLGEASEMAYRLKVLENTEVLKWNKEELSAQVLSENDLNNPNANPNSAGAFCVYKVVTFKNKKNLLKVKFMMIHVVIQFQVY